jgi:uncharacterized protein YkwD
MVSSRSTLFVATIIVLVIVVGILSGASTYYPSSAGSHDSTTAASPSGALTSAATTTTGTAGAGRASSSTASSVSSSRELSTATPANAQVLSGSWLPDNPTFAGNNSRIDYPPGYSTLANFTLDLINKDRASAKWNPVILSSVPSGQQHADSMAYFRYFSHWDTQGYKPYMRYTLLGGTGSVTENIALNYCSNTSQPNATNVGPAPCTMQTVENAINASEWEMVNNDMACCNNTHRDTILGPIHNQVSIGVAYNSTSVYLVEDFQDSYISPELFHVSGQNITLSGTLTRDLPDWLTRQGGSEISIYYDPAPNAISVSQLVPSAACSKFSEVSEPAGCQYQGSYNAGTPVFTVFAPCPAADGCTDGANYTYAQTWELNSTTFNIGFSIKSLEASHGSGVYTFYLWPSERAPEPITSLSIFVNK